MITLFLGLAVFYFTSVLLFSMDKNGPYMSRHQEVAVAVFDDATKERNLIYRPVDLFDRFRRLFGLYSIVRKEKESEKGETWIVHSHRVSLWQCPHCLGFWIAFVLALFVSIWYQDPQAFFLNWWAAAGLNSFIVRFLDAR